MNLRHRRNCVVVALASIQLAFFAASPLADAEPSSIARLIVSPNELPDAVLHNPDMGWVLYENYPLDQDPHGSSTMLLAPNEKFAGVDSVAIMFSWQDVEKSPDKYDFSKVDFAYDYWAHRGKAIQLRLSSETLLWWTNKNPPAGTGVPDYVLEKLSASEKQTRELQGASYVVPDARNRYYRERLAKFLRAVDEHFSEKRPVTLIDLRGFGVWGEWHSGFKYADLDERRDALKGVIDIWSGALPGHRLALSYSYDPDGPKKLYEGTTEKMDERSTGHYGEYLRYSAFDYALTKTNVTYRRDGCGGAVHSNERKLNEEAFRLGRGPMFSEFIDGYTQSKAGGDKWLVWKINDALSLHPNYINLLGWQGGDSLTFIKERADLFNSALARMGYRLVPTHVDYSTSIIPGTPFEIETRWINRGVGRALRDYELRLSLVAADGHIAATTSGGPLPTGKWIAGEERNGTVKAVFKKAPAGTYQLAIALHDNKTNRNIELPIAGGGLAGSYRVGNISITADKPASDPVR
jgi:Domain of unknown function (DUF4832)